MRRPPLVVVFLLIGTWGAVSQSSYIIVDSARLPAESYVGDPVELRYTVRSQANPVVPGEIPQPRWGEITALRVLPGAGTFDFRMTVTPYEPGTLTLPRIDLGEVRIEGLSLVVESILSPGDVGLRPTHGPQRLPGTQAALLLFGFGISFLIALVLYLFGPGRRHIHNIVSRYRARVPYHNLLALVRVLERDIKRYTIREFYIVLVEELQTFMTSRVKQNCTAATSTELIEILPELEESCGALAGTAAPLEEVLIAADSAKFARQTVRLKKRSRHLKLVRAVAVELESHRRRLRRSGRIQRKQVSHVGV
ncbi:MAG: hypothetical protein V3S41_06595 [Spirochaetia bacterium]